MDFSVFGDFTLDMMDRCEANDELDEIKRPESSVELFDAWERAHQDRKELIAEVKRLRGDPKNLTHRIHAWPGATWDPSYCFNRQRDCFCAWTYYYGEK